MSDLYDDNVVKAFAAIQLTLESQDRQIEILARMIKLQEERISKNTELSQKVLDFLKAQAVEH